MNLCQKCKQGKQVGVGEVVVGKLGEGEGW